jgi:4-hydroxy-4-methyl-2-oxoglutarate aldolase
MSEKIGLQELKERYEKLYTGAIADLLDTMGYWNQILPHYMTPIKDTMKVAGPAFTCIGYQVEDKSYDDIHIRLEMLEQFTPFSVAVVKSSNDFQSAHWGEVMSLSARAKGCQGAVVDGGVRDLGQILSFGFPVFARFRSPAGSTRRWGIKAYQVPVKIGETLIHPGDFMVGDVDGVVVVPQAVVEEVLYKAETKIANEQSMKKALAQGKTITEVFNKFGVF